MTSLRQKHLNQALMRIPRRAESTDRRALAATYVMAGSFSAMLHSTDHQILYGRRGTGKTHALLYLADLIERTGDVPVYVDLRTIGSAGGMYPDGSMDLTSRGTHLLVDTLEAVHDELLNLAVEENGREALLPTLDPLAQAASAVQVVGEVERETTAGDKAESSSGIELSARPVVKTSSGWTAHQESRVRRTGVERHHVVFGPLNRALRGIVRALDGARLWLLLDEWSSVPLDLQPLLADLLRRSVLPAAGVTVKIAAIERRSRFSATAPGGDYVGIEVGADAASAVSLDDCMVFDHARTRSQEFFGQLLHNHTTSRLAGMAALAPADVPTFLEETFRRNAFAELVRAAEGVPRDAINIVALAAQHAHSEPIGLPHVRLAARDWYLRDKQTAIVDDEPARQTLRLLVDEVVGRRRSRTFLIDQLTEEESVNALYDARLLHVLRRGLADKRHPGTLYDGFAIDFGCYVSLLLNGELSVPPKDKGSWLSSARGVPPDGFNLAAEIVDLSQLR
ncbi:hypothetical protein [Actinocrispum wychmicini]|nr:hypothetical protein [Actinocrispum wychmicini]